MDRKDRATHTRDSIHHFDRNHDAGHNDPEYCGLFIENLKKGDIISLETTSDKGGFGIRVRLKITHPKQGGVEIVYMARFLGGLTLEIPKNDLGSAVSGTGIFVVRGYRKGKPVVGWVGMSTTIELSKDIILGSVKSISLNYTQIFPQSNTTRH